MCQLCCCFVDIILSISRILWVKWLLVDHAGTKYMYMYVTMLCTMSCRTRAYMYVMCWERLLTQVKPVVKSVVMRLQTFPTNLKQHLNKAHARPYSDIQMKEEEERKKEKKGAAKQNGHSKAVNSWDYCRHFRGRLCAKKAVITIRLFFLVCPACWPAYGWPAILTPLIISRPIIRLWPGLLWMFGSYFHLCQ